MKLRFNFKIKIIHTHNYDSMTEISLTNSWEFKSNTNSDFGQARFCHGETIP